jgi:ribose 5-phosphate isomerase A
MFENTDPAKRAVGYAAVDQYVVDGMCIGLGTGTTAYWAIVRVGQRVAAGENICAIVTSNDTERLCRELGIPVYGLLERPMELAIDGADEVAPDWSLTKGGGGALLREKLIALSAKRYVVIVTEPKLVPTLGRFPLPLEVVPAAAPYVCRELERRFGDVRMTNRQIDGKPFITDNGNMIFDCHFGRIDDAPQLDASLRAVFGVVATGLFYDVVTEVLVGEDSGAVRSFPRVETCI